MKYIIGADEASTGCIAGLMCIAAVKAEANWKFPGLNDSKKLTQEKRFELRDKLYDSVAKGDIFIALESKTSAQVDELGLAASMDDSYNKAIKSLYCNDSYIVLDGKRKFKGLDDITKNYKIEPKADGKYYTVMAASIIAKACHDENIEELDKQYPEYHLKDNSGYVRPNHVEAIKKYGYKWFHRKSYNVKELAHLKNVK